MFQSKLTPISIFALLLIVGGCKNESAPIQLLHPPIQFPAGEYQTTEVTTAGITPDALTLALKAEERSDKESIHALRDKGMIFNLPKGTRVVLTPATPTDNSALIASIGGVKICTGTVESGEKIGTSIALPCDGLRRLP